jgi:hypothetical protein
MDGEDVICWLLMDDDEDGNDDDGAAPADKNENPAPLDMVLLVLAGADPHEGPFVAG